MMDAAAPSPSGIWVDSQGNDVFSKTQVPYYIFQIMLVLYIIGYLGHLVLIQNATVVHTFNYQNNPGVLYSERANSSWWFALCFSCLRIFLFITVCSLITYRKTQCCCGKPGNRGCSLFWTFLLAIFLTFDVIVVAILGSFFSGCNVPGNANNPCNDLRYCHVPEVYNNDDSGCTYKTTWMPPIMSGDLVQNVDFLWLFSTSVVFLAFDFVFLLLPITLWLNSENKKLKVDDVSHDDSSLVFDVLETPESLLEKEIEKKKQFRKKKKKQNQQQNTEVPPTLRQRKKAPPPNAPVIIEEEDEETEENEPVIIQESSDKVKIKTNLLQKKMDKRE